MQTLTSLLICHYVWSLTREWRKRWKGVTGSWIFQVSTHTHTHNLTWLVRTWRLCDCSLRLGTLHPSHPFSTGSSVSLQGECSRCEAKQNTRHQASAEISKTFPTKKEKHKLTAQMFTLVLANTMGLSKNCWMVRLAGMVWVACFTV